MPRVMASEQTSTCAVDSTCNGQLEHRHSSAGCMAPAVQCAAAAHTRVQHPTDLCETQALLALPGHGPRLAPVTGQVTCTVPARNAARWAARATGLTKLENSTHRPASASVALRNVNTLQQGRCRSECLIRHPACDNNLHLMLGVVIWQLHGYASAAMVPCCTTAAQHVCTTAPRPHPTCGPSQRKRQTPASAAQPGGAPAA